MGTLATPLVVTLPPVSQQRSHVYFFSDVHLGSRYHADPRQVEQRLVAWLYEIKASARAIVIVGDLFDYWFEYRYVVPKGHTRLLGALSALSDDGVEVHLFTGNHDVWLFGYLAEECGVILHKEPTLFECDGQRFFVAHGDEYDYRKRSFRLLRAVFHSNLCQKLYAAVHPRWTVPLALGWSLKSRKKGLRQYKAQEYQGEYNEYLVSFAREHHQHSGTEVSYYIFGHRHIMLDLMLSRTARILILGDWINYFSYALWDGSVLVMDQYLEE